MRSPHVSRGTPTFDRRQILRLFGAVAAAGATGGLAACGSEGPMNRARPLSGLTIPVGLVVPKSGPLALIGQEIERGFTLFIEANGYLGPHSVNLITVDEGETAESALAAVNSLLDQSVVAIAGVANPDALAGIAPVVRSQQVPLVSSNAVPANVTNALFVWRTSSTLGDAGRSLGPYARTVGSRSYVIYEDTVTGRDEAAAFTAAFKDRQGTNINEAADYPHPSSIADKLADARNQGAETVFACYSGEDAQRLLDAFADYRASEPPIRLLGTGSITETVDLVSLRPMPAQVYTSMFYAPNLDNAPNRRFVTEYHRRHGSQPTGYAMAAYDSAGVLSRALNLVPGQPTGLEINRAFSGLGQIESPRGTWTFNINRSPQQKWYLRRLHLDGKVPSNLLESDLAVLG
jgi:branched-chain amino acid transport system substrate-binding protein